MKPLLIIQYDDREVKPIFLRLAERNRWYAKHHNYAYEFLRNGYKNYPPYWRKVFLVRDRLMTGNYSGVLWLDTDATVFDLDRPLESLFEPNMSFYKGTDWGGNQIFNAGVWLVLNTKDGRKIMKDWASAYNPSAWKWDASEWSTNGDWAGPEYEQGSFVNRIIPVFKKKIKHTKNTNMQGTTNSFSPGEEKPFILHFTDYLKENVQDFLNRNPLPT